MVDKEAAWDLPFEVVWQSALGALANSGASITSQDQEAGEVNAEKRSALARFKFLVKVDSRSGETVVKVDTTAEGPSFLRSFLIAGQNVKAMNEFWKNLVKEIGEPRSYILR